MRSIFVSSTFKDMMNERDLLQEYITPELNEIIRKYHEEIFLTDLRWGVNTEDLDTDEGSKKVLEVCFDEIEKCKPYMIILIGERYGWIPNIDLIHETTDKYNLKVNKPLSVTEMEIEFGALSQENLDKCIFCFRNEIDKSEMSEEDKIIYSTESEEHKKKLEALKQKILKKNPKNIINYSISYQDGRIKISDNFKKEIINIISKDIEKDNENKEILPWQEQEVLYAKKYIENHNKTFIGRQKLLSRFEYQIENTHNYLYIISGEPGSGKSAILSKLFNIFNQKENIDVYPFIIENSERSITVLDLYNGLNYYISKLTKTEYKEYKIETDARDEYFRKIEEYNNIFKGKRTLITFIDTPAKENEYQDIFEYDWAFPLDNQKFVLTLRNKNIFPSRCEYNYLKVPYLEKEDIENIIKSISKEYKKELSKEIIKKISSKKNSTNVTYLTLLIRRLMMLGQEDFRIIRERGDGIKAINNYLSEIIEKTEDNLTATYAQLVETAIYQIENGKLSYALRLIAISRNGIKKNQIFEILKMMDINLNELDLTRFMRYLKGFFKETNNDKISFTNNEIINIFNKNINNNSNLTKNYINYLLNLKYQSEEDIKDLCYLLNNRTDSEETYMNLYFDKKNKLKKKKQLITKNLLLYLRKNYNEELTEDFYNKCIKIINQIIIKKDIYEDFLNNIIDVTTSQNLYRVTNALLEMTHTYILNKYKKKEISLDYLVITNYNRFILTKNFHNYNNTYDEFMITIQKDYNPSFKSLKMLAKAYKAKNDSDYFNHDENIINVSLWEYIYQKESSLDNAISLLEIYKQISNSNKYDKEEEKKYKSKANNLIKEINDKYKKELTKDIISHITLIKNELKQTKIIKERNYKEGDIQNQIDSFNKLKELNSKKSSKQKELKLIDYAFEIGKYYFTYNNYDASLDYFYIAYKYALIAHIKYEDYYYNNIVNLIHDMLKLEKNFNTEVLKLKRKANTSWKDPLKDNPKTITKRITERFIPDTQNKDEEIKLVAYQTFKGNLTGDAVAIVSRKIVSIANHLKEKDNSYWQTYIDETLALIDSLHKPEEEKEAKEILDNLYNEIKKKNPYHKDLSKVNYREEIEKNYLNDKNDIDRSNAINYINILNYYLKLYSKNKTEENIKIYLEKIKEYLIALILYYNKDLDIGDEIIRICNKNLKELVNRNNFYTIEEYYCLIIDNFLIPLTDVLMKNKEFYNSEDYLNKVINNLEEKTERYKTIEKEENEIDEILSKVIKIEETEYNKKEKTPLYEDYIKITKKTIDNINKQKEKYNKLEDEYFESNLKEELNIVKGDDLTNTLYEIFSVAPLLGVFTKERLAASIGHNNIYHIEIILELLVQTKKIIKMDYGLYFCNIKNIYYDINNTFVDLPNEEDDDLMSLIYEMYKDKEPTTSNDTFKIFTEVLAIVCQSKEIYTGKIYEKYNKYNIEKLLNDMNKMGLISREKKDTEDNCYVTSYVNKKLFPELNYFKDNYLKELDKKVKDNDKDITKLKIRLADNKEDSKPKYIKELENYLQNIQIENNFSSIDPLYIINKYLLYEEYIKKESIRSNLNNEIIRSIKRLTENHLLLHRLLINDAFNDYINKGITYDYPQKIDIYIYNLFGITPLKNLPKIKKASSTHLDEQLNMITKKYKENKLLNIYSSIESYFINTSTITRDDLKTIFSLNDEELRTIEHKILPSSLFKKINENKYIIRYFQELSQYIGIFSQEDKELDELIRYLYGNSETSLELISKKVKINAEKLYQQLKKEEYIYESMFPKVSYIDNAKIAEHVTNAINNGYERPIKELNIDELDIKYYDLLIYLKNNNIQETSRIKIVKELKIGYNKTGKILETLINRGIAWKRKKDNAIIINQNIIEKEIDKVSKLKEQIEKDNSTVNTINNDEQPNEENILYTNMISYLKTNNIKKLTPSTLQRKFKIGYKKATTLIDKLLSRNIIKDLKSQQTYEVLKKGLDEEYDMYCNIVTIDTLPELSLEEILGEDTINFIKKEVIPLAIRNGKISTSLIQGVFNIPFGRSDIIMNYLKEEEYIKEDGTFNKEKYK